MEIGIGKGKGIGKAKKKEKKDLDALRETLKKSTVWVSRKIREVYKNVNLNFSKKIKKYRNPWALKTLKIKFKKKK